MGISQNMKVDTERHLFVCTLCCTFSTVPSCLVLFCNLPVSVGAGRRYEQHIRCIKESLVGRGHWLAETA
jgi:hypothetical protein